MKNDDKALAALDELVEQVHTFREIAPRLTPDAVAEAMAMGFQGVLEEVSKRLHTPDKGYNLADAFNERVSEIAGVLEAGWPY